MSWLLLWQLSGGQAVSHYGLSTIPLSTWSPSEEKDMDAVADNSSDESIIPENKEKPTSEWSDMSSKVFWEQLGHRPAILCPGHLSYTPTG